MIPPRSFRRLVALLLLSAGGSVPALAEGLDATVHLDAGVWGYQSSQQPQDTTSVPVSASVLARGRWPDEHLRAVLDARVGDSAAFGDRHYGVVREAYVEGDGDLLTVRVGQMLLPWGRADSINPTDSLVSRNYQWRTPSEEEQKFGNAGMRVQVPVGDYTASAVWLPFMQSSVLPYLPVLADVAPPEAGYVSFTGNGGVRLDHTGEPFDWGLSYYQGLDVSPSLSAHLTLPRTPFAWYNGRIQRVGADFAAGLGATTMRGEIAYTNERASGPTGPAVLSGDKNDSIRAVLGFDYGFAPEANLNLQAVYQHVIGGPPAPEGPVPPTITRIVALQNLLNLQPVTDLYGLAFRASQRYFNDTLTLEVSGQAYAEGQGGTVRPRAAYQLTDALSVQVGANWYFGGSTGLFGAQKANNVVFGQVRYALTLGQ